MGCLQSQTSPVVHLDDLTVVFVSRIQCMLQVDEDRFEVHFFNNPIPLVHRMSYKKFRSITRSIVRAWPSVFVIGPRGSLVSVKHSEYVASSAPYVYTVVCSHPLPRVATIGRSKPVSQADLPDIVDNEEDDHNQELLAP